MYRYIVGIDVSENSFSVCGLNGEGTVLFSLGATMDRHGFYELSKVISSCTDDPSTVIVAMESTDSITSTLSPSSNRKGFL